MSPIFISDLSFLRSVCPEELVSLEQSLQGQQLRSLTLYN
jgi:hypothetical protein